MSDFMSMMAGMGPANADPKKQKEAEHQRLLIMASGMATHAHWLAAKPRIIARILGLIAVPPIGFHVVHGLGAETPTLNLLSLAAWIGSGLLVWAATSLIRDRDPEVMLARAMAPLLIQDDAYRAKWGEKKRSVTTSDS